MIRNDFWRVFEKSLVSRIGQVKRNWNALLKRGIDRWRLGAEERLGWVEPMEPRLMMTGTPIIIDNGGTGFSTTGTWTTYNNPSLPSYGGNSLTSLINKGASATWKFTDLEPGMYEVYSTWSHSTNRATDAHYEVRDVNDDTLFSTGNTDQSKAPSGLTEDSWNWSILGTFEVRSDVLSVKLTDTATTGTNVFADGVLIRRTDDLDDPEVQVSDASGSNLLDGATWDWGRVLISGDGAREITIKNMGDQPLDVSRPFVSGGFTLLTGPDVSTLGAGASTKVTIKVNQDYLGMQTGLISFASTDSDEDPFTIQLTAAINGPTYIIDNGGTGFATSGTGWSSYSTIPGYNTTSLVSSAGKGDDIATWTFSGLTPGHYRVYGTWPASTNRASNAPFTVTDVSESVTYTPSGGLDQRVTPNDITEDGIGWEVIASSFELEGTTLQVKVTDNADNFVFADGVMIQRIDELDGPPNIQLTYADGRKIEDGWGANIGSGYVIDDTLSHTFRITNVGSGLLKLDNSKMTVPSGYMLSKPSDVELSPGESTTFTITREDTNAGWVEGMMEIVSDDPDTGTFDVLLYSELYEPAVYVAGPGDVEEDETYTLNLSAFGFKGVSDTKWSIDWGDGETTSADAVDRTATHTYTGGGSYEIEATWITPSKNYVPPSVVVDVESTGVPSTPELVSSEFKGAGVSLTWTGDGSKTRIEYAIRENALEPAIYSDYMLLMYTDPGTFSAGYSTLFTGVEYKFRVISVNSSGMSSASNEITGTTQPERPQHIWASVNDDSSNNVVWDNVTGEEGYKVYRRSTDEVDWTLLDTLDEPDETTYLDESAVEGEVYFYHVVAYNEAGSFDTKWAEAKITTLPKAPVIVSANVTAPNTVTVTWTKESKKPLLNFRIDRWQDTGTWAQVATADDEATTINVAGEEGDKFRVRAVNLGGSSVASGEKLVQVDDPNEPDPPTGLKIEEGSSSRLRDLSWTKVDGATEYEISVRSPYASNPNWEVYVTFDGLLLEGFNSGEMAVWPQIDFRVRAVKWISSVQYYSDSSYISYLATVAGTGSSNPVPAPTDFKMSPAETEGKTKLSWTYGDPPSDSFSLVDLGPTSSPSWFLEISKSLDYIEVADTLLSSGTRIAIIALDTDEDQPASLISNIITVPGGSPPVPIAPSEVVAIQTRPNEAILRWTDLASNEIGYKIYRSKDGDDAEYIATKSADEVSYVDFDVIAGHAYSYSVVSYNVHGESSAGTSGFTATQSVIGVYGTQNMAWEGDSATDQPTEPGQMVFRRYGDSSTALTVNYTRSGEAVMNTDYAMVDAVVYFPAGVSAIAFAIDPTDDVETETGGEEAIFTIITPLDDGLPFYDFAVDAPVYTNEQTLLQYTSEVHINEPKMPVAVTSIAVALDTSEGYSLDYAYFDFFASITIVGTGLENAEIRQLVSASTVTFAPETGYARTDEEVLADMSGGIDRNLLETNGELRVAPDWNWQDVDVVEGKGEHSDHHRYYPPVQEIGFPVDPVTVFNVAILSRTYVIQVRDKTTEEVLFEKIWGYDWKSIPKEDGIPGTHLVYVAGETEIDGEGEFSDVVGITGLS